MTGSRATTSSAGWSRFAGATATSSDWSATRAACWPWWTRSSALRFTYQDELLASVTDPSGRTLRYEYEAPNSFEPKRLSKVIYPDATPADPNDNPFVRYLYEDTRFAYALTGMIDEKGDRFATWQYDAEMRVVSSEHAGAVDRFTASYDRANLITTITNPLTKETRHHFALVEGKWKPTRIEGRPSAGCAAADQLLGYDGKGFVASRTDWNGNVTNYVNDSRGLPTSITEAVGTPLARTRNITWHSSLRLPTQITALRLTTSFTYDGDGNLLSRTETDTTSHSQPYPTNGQQRAWTLTYADAGPVLGTPSAAVALTLVNPAAESGSLTGWTSELGAFTTASSNPSPAEGTRYFTAGSVAESLMRQDVALPGAVLAQVDAGLGLVRLLWKQRNVDTTSDRGSATLAFLDASGQPLGSTYEGKQLAVDSWTERSLELLVPPGARTVRLKLHGLRVSGTKNDAHFDDVRLSYEPLFTARPRLLASIDGPRSDVADTTGFTHDTSGNLTGVTNALGQVTQIAAHDARGLPLTVIDPNGVQSTLTYDERGRLLSATVDSGTGDSPATTTFGYDPVGQVTRVTLPDGSQLDYAWDAAHRLTGVTNSLGETIEYTRDAMGNVTGTDVKSAGGTIVRSQGAAFDELGRLLRDIGAVAQITAYGYDKNDNLTSLTDPLSHATAFAYDALDRLVRQTDAVAGETDRAWDARDGLASLADPRDVTTSFVRNGFGEVIQEASPDRGTTVYVRDAAGNVTQRSDGRGVVTSATFDALDRQLTETFPATPALNRSFGYDATTGGNKGIGRLTSLADAQGSASFRYDARGNLVSEIRVIGGQSYTTSYGWDLADNLVSLTYPSGRIVEYARDGLGRVTGVTTRANATASPVTLASGIGWRPFGPIAAMGLGNGLAVSYSYDTDGRLTGIAASPGIQGLTLSYDTASRLTGIADALLPGRSQTLGYDALDRLTSATGGYGSLTYGWDAGSNRTSRAWTQGGTTTTDSATYAGTSNRLLSVGRGGQSRSLGHDAAGNVTTDTRFDGTAFGYGYDGDGRLANVTRNALPEATYGYDAFQRRVLKTTGGVTRHFLHDPDGHLLAEATSAGVTATEYVWLGDAPLAMVADADTASPRLYWFHTDQLGTPQKLTDQAGNLAWDAVLEPFGELASLTVNLVAQPLRLPGQYPDLATGLHQNWHRDYDPTLGRYLQPDPLGIRAAANLYGYVDGNPITGFDRDGRIWDTLLDLGFLGYDLHRLAMDGPCGLGENLTALGADLVGAALPFVSGLGLATRGVGKGLGGNPFRGKTRQQVDELLRGRGFVSKGPDPLSGRGSYFHPQTGRKYYIDQGGVYRKGIERPHVDVHRIRNGANVEGEKRRLPFGEP